MNNKIIKALSLILATSLLVILNFNTLETERVQSNSTLYSNSNISLTNTVKAQDSCGSCCLVVKLGNDHLYFPEDGHFCDIVGCSCTFV